jgi:catechol 2,3-dioxygenase-like lactoylglutathione lyase family enzyme
MIAFDHCVIHVSDWERCNAFYQDVLKAEIVPNGIGGFAYRFGPVQLNCHGPGAIGEPRAREPVMPGGSDLCFEWQGPIGTALSHLADHGIEPELGPVRRFGAKGEGSSVYFRDPDGSLLEFISYV